MKVRLVQQQNGKWHCVDEHNNVIDTFNTIAMAMRIIFIRGYVLTETKDKLNNIL
jgi:hypothetical protein